MHVLSVFASPDCTALSTSHDFHVSFVHLFSDRTTSGWNYKEPNNFDQILCKNLAKNQLTGVDSPSGNPAVALALGRIEVDSASADGASCLQNTDVLRDEATAAIIVVGMLK